jgi:putative ABC transport system permease protein
VAWLLRELTFPHWARHAPRTTLTLLSIAIGVAAIVATSVVSQSVFASFENMVTATAGRADLQITNGGLGVPEELVDQLAAVSDVRNASPFLSGFVALPDAPGAMLSVYGFDLLADEETLARVPRSAIHIPDRGDFIAKPGSVALTSSFAASHGYHLGSAFDVVTPRGTRRLFVRGIIDEIGPVALLGDSVSFVDMSTAQEVLAREGRVDRIDLRLRAGSDVGAVRDALETAIRGRARVHSVVDEGGRVRDLLGSLRVVLALAGAIATVVGFFIIYHSVDMSIAERRADIGLLGALGVGPRTVLAWVLSEAVILGLVASILGVLIGLGIATVSLSLFSQVTTAWVATPRAQLSISLLALANAVAIGVGIVVVATALAARALFRQPVVSLLSLARTPSRPEGGTRQGPILGVAALAVAALLLWLAPRTLPYRQLVGFILGVNCLVLAGFGLVSPLPALLIGRTAVRLTERLRGISVFLASSAVHRSPGSLAPVVTAIVMALGWSLANTSLVESFKGSWLGWLKDYYRSDLVVTAGGRVSDILTAPAFSDEVIAEIGRLPDVTEVDAIRRIAIDYDGRPTMLIASDRSSAPLPLLDATWPAIEAAFWPGDGVVVSDTLAHRAALSRGQSITLVSPTGPLTLPILATYRDIYGGDLGAIALSRTVYHARWGDSLVDRVRVWTRGSPAGARQAINEKYGPTYGLQAVSFDAQVSALNDLIENSFVITYALVFICLAVSAVGVANFLLTAILDRRREYETMHALGLSPRQIAGSVAAEGGFVGLTGVVVGLAAGVVVSAVIILHSVPMVNGWHFTFVFPVRTALVISGVVVLAASVVGLLPGLAAARPLPVQERSE